MIWHDLAYDYRAAMTPHLMPASHGTVAVAA
jgi:hypothetical protein